MTPEVGFLILLRRCMHLAWGPPLFSLILLYVSQFATQIIDLKVRRKLPLTHWLSLRNTRNRDREKSSCQNHYVQYLNCRSHGMVAWTSGQPHVILSLLRSISLQIRPMTKRRGRRTFKGTCHELGLKCLIQKGLSWVLLRTSAGF